MDCRGVCTSPDRQQRGLIAVSCGVGVPPARPAVGDLDEHDGDRTALLLVSVECGGAQPSLPHVGEQEREVVGVLQAGVHSLAANRGVHVPGIASEKDRTVPERRGDAMVHHAATRRC
jgi:hypothetical protein